MYIQIGLLIIAGLHPQKSNTSVTHHLSKKPLSFYHNITFTIYFLRKGLIRCEYVKLEGSSYLEFKQVS